MVFNYLDGNNNYRLELHSNPQTALLFEVKNGANRKLAEASFTGGGQGVYSTIKVTNNGKTTSVEINGNVVFNNIATTAFRYGKIGLYAWYQPVWYDDVEVVAESKGFPVGINTIEANEKSLVCFPNPFTGRTLTVQLAKVEKNIRLQIFNLSGQIVWSTQTVEATSFSVPANAFPINGMYLIQLTSDENFHQGKIIYSGR